MRTPGESIEVEQHWFQAPPALEQGGLASPGLSPAELHAETTPVPEPVGKEERLEQNPVVSVAVCETAPSLPETVPSPFPTGRTHRPSGHTGDVVNDARAGPSEL